MQMERAAGDPRVLLRLDDPTRDVTAAAGAVLARHRVRVVPPILKEALGSH